MLTTNFAEAGGFLRSGPDVDRPDLQLHFVVGKLIDHGRKTVFGHGYSCHVCLLRPKSRGSVTLASADPLAAPLIDPNFLAERDDVDRLVRGFKAMRRILAQPALAGHGARELAASAAARSDAEIEALHPRPRRHDLPPGRHLPHGQRARSTSSTPSCACAASRGCASSTRRSCRASSAATPTRRRS